MKRLVLLVVALVALAAPANAGAALFYLFDRPTTLPNDRMTVRAGGTPKTFILRQRVKPFQRPVRLYLLREEDVAQVHSRFDARLIFIGSIVPDKNGRALLTFSVPPLDAGTYTIAYWCPACARYSRGRTFYVQEVDQFVERYRSQALLRIETTMSCSVTLPNGNRPPGQPRSVAWYGNGLLWAGLAADGVYAVSPDRVGADGSIGNKLLWVTTPPWRAPTVSGERLDASGPPLRVLGMNQGSFSGAANPSFMSPVTFPAAGCWRLTARVRDVSLTYVVSVVVRQARFRRARLETTAAAVLPSTYPSRDSRRRRTALCRTRSRHRPRAGMPPRRHSRRTRSADGAARAPRTSTASS